jgi:hypothetical protein
VSTNTIYAAKRSTGSLPAGAGLRYFAGIARHCQHERELRIFEQELVALLENEQVSVAAHLQRQAATLAPLDLAPRLGAIVREILIAVAPVPRVFWSRRLAAEAASAAPQIRAPFCSLEDRAAQRLPSLRGHERKARRAFPVPLSVRTPRVS